MEEAERLVKAGVRELLVISQDTGAYGVDTKFRTGFWNGRPLKTHMQQLCEALAEFGIWVRLHYVYPYPHVDNVIALMAQRKILPYLDIPFQHGSPRILKTMKRPAAAENTLERIHIWRSLCPDITLRSTFIVGFPGETDADFDILLDFLQAAQLDRVSCFQYSPVDGARARLQAKIGTTQQILIDTVDAEGAIGRSMAAAPEIDGQVHLPGITDLQAGDFVEAEITAADEYDMWVE